MIITTHDTDGRPFTMHTFNEDDGRVTLHVTIGSKRPGGRNVVSSMVHLSETDSTALKSAFPNPPTRPCRVCGVGNGTCGH